MARKSALLVVNAGASGAALLDDESLAPLHAAMDVRVERPDEPPQISELIEAHGGGVDLIIIGGGDGTVSRSVKSLLAVGKPFAILPLGTANDFARTLEMSNDLPTAMAQIVDGVVHHIDAGKVNDTYFLNVASVGLAAEVSAAQSKSEKKRWRYLAYPMNLWRAMRNAKPVRIGMRCDDETVRRWVYQVSVGNGRYHGGGLLVAPEARIDDATFHVYCVVPRSHWSFATVLAALRLGGHRWTSSIETFVARHVELRTTRNMPINVDGETLERTPAVFEMQAGVLEVVVPRDSEMAVGEQQLSSSDVAKPHAAVDG